MLKIFNNLFVRIAIVAILIAVILLGFAISMLTRGYQLYLPYTLRNHKDAALYNYLIFHPNTVRNYLVSKRDESGDYSARIYRYSQATKYIYFDDKQYFVDSPFTLSNGAYVCGWGIAIFVILLVAALALLGVSIALLVKRKNAPPTKSQRIAELERQVQELTQKGDE